MGGPTQMCVVFRNAAATLGSDRSAELRRYMEWYVGRPGAELPQRPDKTEAETKGSGELRESFRAQHRADDVLLPGLGVGTEAGTVARRSISGCAWPSPRPRARLGVEQRVQLDAQRLGPARPRSPSRRVGARASACPGPRSPPHPAVQAPVICGLLPGRRPGGVFGWLGGEHVHAAALPRLADPIVIAIGCAWAAISRFEVCSRFLQTRSCMVVPPPNGEDHRGNRCISVMPWSPRDRARGRRDRAGR